MKIITYSDLHLEFGTDFLPSTEAGCDLMILAGDIINLDNFERLDRFLKGWKKPVLYVAGNHEYYTHVPMNKSEENFKTWLAEGHSNVTLLRDEAISIQGVNFFGGTMWTDFCGGSQNAMNEARMAMPDFEYIRNPDGRVFDPEDTIVLHENFKNKLISWFEKTLDGTRVVITHHAPVTNPRTKHKGSKLMPAFNSLDMLEIIEKYKPRLWVYGHTHECDRQTIGRTQILSNQLGYPHQHVSGYECEDFDKDGALVAI